MKAKPEVEADHDDDEHPEAGVDAHEEGGDAAGVRLPQRHLVLVLEKVPSEDS